MLLLGTVVIGVGKKVKISYNPNLFLTINTIIKVTINVRTIFARKL